MKRLLRFDDLFAIFDPARRYGLFAEGDDNNGGGITPSDARTFLTGFGHAEDALKGMPDPDVVKLHGTVMGTLDKVRPAQTDWKAGITDSALKPVVEPYKTPEEAIRALSAPKDWRSDIADENLKKTAEPYKTPADAIKALAEKSTEWRKTVTDPDALKEAERTTDLNAAFKRIVELTKLNSGAIRVPGKDAKPEEVAAFRKALGVPEKPDGYVFNRPEHIAEDEFKSEPVQGVVKAFAEAAHAAGMSKEAAAAVFDWYGKVEALTLANQEKADNDYAEAGTAALKAKWGGDYDANIAYANRAVAKVLGANLDAAKQVQDKQGRFVMDNPLFLEAFAALGREMAEGTLGGANEDERKSLTEQIDEVRKKARDANEKGDTKIANEYYRQEQALLAKRDGNKTIVGSARAA